MVSGGIEPILETDVQVDSYCKSQGITRQDILNFVNDKTKVLKETY